jgi:hypothetical protein
VCGAEQRIGGAFGKALALALALLKSRITRSRSMEIFHQQQFGGRLVILRIDRSSGHPNYSAESKALTKERQLAPQDPQSALAEENA